MIFAHKYINTEGHSMVDTKWTFRGCFVTMHETGFSCNCQKRPRQKCKHIKSVEMGILGVGCAKYKTERD